MHSPYDGPTVRTMKRGLACGTLCAALLLVSACASTMGRTPAHVVTEKSGTPGAAVSASGEAVHVGSHTSASGLCHAAHVGRVISASTTSVHAVRSITGGWHHVPVLPDALRPAAPSARAAWCWTAAEGTPASAKYGVYHAYVVTDGVPPQFIGRMQSPRSMASGEYPFRA